MRTFLGMLGPAGLAVIAAGCLATAAPSPSTHRTGTRPLLANAPPGTQVVVRYAATESARRGLPMLNDRCPAPARCRAVRIQGARPRRWALVASRTLTCDPDRGGYADPAAACGALRDLARIEAHRGPNVCMCPVEIGPRPTVIGHIDGRRIRFMLDACSLCGLGAHAGADARVLLAA
jgi:hypothetical protein